MLMERVKLFIVTNRKLLNKALSRTSYYIINLWMTQRCQLSFISLFI